MDNKTLRDLEEKALATALKGSYIEATLDPDVESFPTMMLITLPTKVADFISTMSSISPTQSALWLEWFLIQGIEAVCTKWNLNDPQAREFLAKELAQVKDMLLFKGTKH